MSERRIQLGVSLLVAALSWPLASDLEPSLGGEADWQIALQLAVRQGLDFGPDVLFTYGPLGFLHYPLIVDAALARVAFVYTIAIHVGVCLVLLWGLRPALRSLPLAALGTLVVASVIYEGAPIVIGFGAAAALVTGRVEQRRALLVAAGLGALAALELLAKLNTGITLLGLAAIAIACAPAVRSRVAAALAGAFAVALGLGWLVTGQSLGAADDYVIGGFWIVSGYSEAMGLDDPQLAASPGEYVAALGIAVLGGYAVWNASAALERRGRVGLGLLWALLWFTAFKAAFVRPDALHVNIFFGSTLGALAVIGWSSERRRTPILLGCALLVALGISLSRDGRGLPDGFFSPWERTRNLTSQSATLLDGSRTAAAIKQGRRARVLDAGVSAPVLAAAKASPSHIDPLESGLAWAYDLPWHPIPVFQSYSAYTSDLDERNADALSDPNGPAAVLRHAGSVDRRNPDWESPAAMRALLCHFEVRAGDREWQTLERTATRCGRERPLARTTVRLGTPAPVPAPPDRESMVLARIDGIEVGGLEKLRALAFRAVTRHAVLNGNRRFRFVPGTAGDGLIMSVPPAADFPAPLGLDHATRTLAVLRGKGEQPDDEVTIRWSAVSIRDTK